MRGKELAGLHVRKARGGSGGADRNNVLNAMCGGWVSRPGINHGLGGISGCRFQRKKGGTVEWTFL